MPPIRLNRRRFLGASAAAGWTLANAPGVEAEVTGTPSKAGGPIRLGLIGVGNRGTSLLRAALAEPDTHVVAVADVELKHRERAAGIAARASGKRPEVCARYEELLAMEDVDAVLVALPCDLHAQVYAATLRAGKHLYGEKPLAPTLAECDRLIAIAAERPDLAFHVGFQRRSSPRYRSGLERIRGGEIGQPLECRARLTSSQGPMTGHANWLGRRTRSGDWMVEQAVHVWDVLLWLKGVPPISALGGGRRDLFAATDPGRDVTDWYSAQIEWADGFRASFVQSWIDPPDDAYTGAGLQILGTDGGLDLGSGVLTPRDRSRPREPIHPGRLPETELAVRAFLDAVRAEASPPPPTTLAEAGAATRFGLMVRKAVDERRVVTWDEAGDS